MNEILVSDIRSVHEFLCFTLLHLTFCFKLMQVLSTWRRFEIDLRKSVTSFSDKALENRKEAVLQTHWSFLHFISNADVSDVSQQSASHRLFLTRFYYSYAYLPMFYRISDYFASCLECISLIICRTNHEPKRKGIPILFVKLHRLASNIRKNKNLNCRIYCIQGTESLISKLPFSGAKYFLKDLSKFFGVQYLSRVNKTFVRPLIFLPLQTYIFLRICSYKCRLSLVA